MRAIKTPLGNYFYGDVLIKMDELAASTGWSKRYIIKNRNTKRRVFDTLKQACEAIDRDASAANLANKNNLGATQ